MTDRELKTLLQRLQGNRDVSEFFSYIRGEALNLLVNGRVDDAVEHLKALQHIDSVYGMITDVVVEDKDGTR